MKHNTDEYMRPEEGEVPAATCLRPKLAPASGMDGRRAFYAATLLARSMGLSPPVLVLRSVGLGPGLHLPGGVFVGQSELDAVFEDVSMERELKPGRTDRHGRFDETAISWDCSDPWVSRMARELREKVAATGQIEVAPTREFRVIVTHDIDRVTPAEPTSLLKAFAGHVGIRRGSWLGFSDAVKPRLFLRNLERMLDLELQCGVRPWFFMLAGNYGLGRYSNRYGIRWNLAREAIRLIQEAGGEIGLHGSYHARDRDSYRAEASLLADIVGCPVVAQRNHYLRFDSRNLWSQLEEAGIRLDFSLCFSSRMGFRVPVTGPFNPFDWKSQKTSEVRAIPTIAMDKVWWPEKEEEVLSELEALLWAAKEVGGTVAILIHPEMLSFGYRWFSLFEAMIKTCRDVGAAMDTSSGDLLSDEFGVEE